MSALPLAAVVVEYVCELAVVLTLMAWPGVLQPHRVFGTSYSEI